MFLHLIKLLKFLNLKLHIDRGHVENQKKNNTFVFFKLSSYELRHAKKVHNVFLHNFTEHIVKVNF